tara:strand:+ start:3356 stop:3808 length:453 start_codon:yes stop_codon:yes gene_type:complete
MRKVIISILLLMLFTGCAPREILRVVGIGTEPFKSKGKVSSQIIEKDFFTSYNETLRIIKKMEADAYRGSPKKGFIVARSFISSFGDRCSDATEVAVFFTESEKNKTEVAVSSLNFSLADFVAKHIFDELSGKDNSDQDYDSLDSDEISQ